MLLSIRPEVVVVEDYPFKASGNAITKQAEIGGILREAIAAVGVPIIEINVQTWKSVMHRSPKGTKAKDSAYLDATFACIEVNVATPDIADAAMILVTCDKAMDEAQTGAGMVKLRAALQGVMA
jgi:Holliday junction resolvasome RuvABC endonuclease subunit